MFITKYYLLGVLLSAALAWFTPWLVLKLLFTWVALSLAIVSFAYLFNIPSVFRKNSDGKIVYWIQWAFIPFMLGIRGYNAWARKYDSVPAIQKISDDLYLSRRLLPSDLDYLKSQNIDCILDLTAEFAGLESAMTDKHFQYLTLPVLDHKAPSLNKLRHALCWIDAQRSQSRSVVIHCALGRGRSVFVMAAYLLSQDPELTVDQALADIHSIRSSANLNKRQYKVLTSIHQKQKLLLPTPTWMIVNPVSGSRKWQQHQQQLIRELTKKYCLNIIETSRQTTATALAKQAVKENAKQIIVCGGDGTVTEVAEQIIETDIVLGIVPFGTANALCHVLYGLEAKFSPVESACKAILSDQVRTIDTARCNDKLMLLVMGIGFEQQMIESANRENKNQYGQMAYLSGFFNAIASDNPQKLTIKIDDQPLTEVDVQSLVVANIAPFSTVLAHGGDVPEPDDGKLHVTYLDYRNSISERVLALSDLAFSSLGMQDKSTEFEYRSGNHIDIFAKHEINYVVDGEQYSASHISFSILPSSLKVKAVVKS
ncbi:diacylglycerol kinase family protein [Psychromonas sp. 14N.309.X.WAT.B.A12]|uniref:diacylglycerol kinase family protein n=1 Tax=Psychromonas sp. 14N.309.X.WAT.B.A12 TaxID=2998322 RepID=UPI0025AFD3E8|nr:diacylglycerol kinase family protein [Psychromonas sp. 14N.309.X.WAT.B.A12]MDN2664886.1 diacylglycerol kinase family protein [Psychromonas sp. 14N.309.X.WAT.B.A12]